MTTERIEVHEERGLAEQPSDSPRRRWVEKMVKSSKRYHKLCPYFDKKTTQCLLMVTVEGRMGLCDRDGKYDNCPIFMKFLEKVYDSYTSRKKVLPRDFQEVVNQVFIF